MTEQIRSLKKIIKAVNALPFDEARFEELIEIAGGRNGRLDDLVWDELQKYSGRHEDKVVAVSSTKRRMIHRMALISLMVQAKGNELPQSIRNHYNRYFNERGWPVLNTTKLIVNETTGLIDIADDGLSAFIQTLRGLDPDRLRFCKGCDEIFWADRKNKWTCSVRCSNRWQKRLERDREKKAKRELEEANGTKLKKRRK